MDHPIVEKILKEGISSVNLSMLDESARKRILSDVGEKLYKESKFIEAVEILAKANDIERLTKWGDAFLAENKTELAALCFLPTKDKQRLNNVAVLCRQSKNYKMAAKAYEAADNEQMISRLERNKEVIETRYRLDDVTAVEKLLRHERFLFRNNFWTGILLVARAEE